MDQDFWSEKQHAYYISGTILRIDFLHFSQIYLLISTLVMLRQAIKHFEVK